MTPTRAERVFPSRTRPRSWALGTIIYRSPPVTLRFPSRAKLVFLSQTRNIDLESAVIRPVRVNRPSRLHRGVFGACLAGCQDRRCGTPYSTSGGDVLDRGGDRIRGEHFAWRRICTALGAVGVSAGIQICAGDVLLRGHRFGGGGSAGLCGDGSLYWVGGFGVWPWDRDVTPFTSPVCRSLRR